MKIEDLKSEMEFMTRLKEFCGRYSNLEKDNDCSSFPVVVFLKHPQQLNYYTNVSDLAFQHNLMFVLFVLLVKK